MRFNFAIMTALSLSAFAIGLPSAVDPRDGNGNIARDAGVTYCCQDTVAVSFAGIPP